MSTPASRIIEKFGGPKAVAELLNLNVCNVHRWTYPRTRGGTGGLVPQRHQTKLLDIAERRNIPLEEADFFPRRREAA